MIGTAFLVMAGVGLLLAKLRRRTALRLLHHDLALDLGVTVLVMLLHYGTYSGMIVASIAGLMCSMATSSLKRLVGYVDGNVYYPGRIRLDV